ncbi:MAG: ATP-binding protein [Acidimicrobiales bacterium]
MAGPEVRVATFSPTAASSGEARRFVTNLLDDWALSALVPDAGLCVSELAANAVLHARGPFTIAVRRTGHGVHIDVLDPCPDQLPVAVPRSGSAADLTRRSTTGRGLQIVAALSDRWGVSTAKGAKAVWIELSDAPPPADNPAVVVLGHQPPSEVGEPLQYPGLPVRTAVASGIQVDEIVRDLQLALLSREQGEAPIEARLLDLLHRSAPVRLAGRYAALHAASEGRSRFDLDVVASEEALAAVGSLAQLLSSWSARRSTLISRSDDAQIDAFRAWLGEETGRQRAGEAPTRCPLPT